MNQNKTKKYWMRNVVGRIALFFCFVMGIAAFFTGAGFSDHAESATGAGLSFVAAVLAFGIIVAVAYFSPTQQPPEQISSSPVAHSKSPDGTIIEINAKSAKDAALQIAQYLKQARADGWTTGKAFALIDGWRNEYQIEKGDQKSILTFDMRPTLKNVPSNEVTIMTMIAAVDNPEIEKNLSQFP